tara:strand:+ start:1251 stop:2513 length:1263 start_codon:yes stop_codon:yes gene_type:complete
MHNKKKILNEEEKKGEISLALIGLIMKKIYKVGFKIVYEKLLMDGDDGAGKFFKIEGDKFTIENYDALLNDEKIDDAPTFLSEFNEQRLIQLDDQQKSSLTDERQEYAKKASEKLKGQVNADKEDKSIFDTIKNFFSPPATPTPTSPPPQLTSKQRKEFKELIYKYDPLRGKDTNTHIFPYTKLEEYFIMKRTDLKEVYNIISIVDIIKDAAKIYHQLKKIRLIILKVQEASRGLTRKQQMQKTPSAKDVDIQTISDILTEEEVELDSQVNDVDNVINTFVKGKGNLGMNPFAIADKLLYDLYGEDKIKSVMDDARKIHDEFIKVAKYILAVSNSRKMGVSKDKEETEDLKQLGGEDLIKNVLERRKEKVLAKHTYGEGEKEKNVGDKVIKILDVLAGRIIEDMVKDEEIADPSPEGEES